MMSFTMFIVSLIVLMMAGGVYYWLGASFLILSYILFSMNGGILQNFYYLGSGMGLDTASFSLISLSLWVSVVMLISSQSIYDSGVYIYFSLFVGGLMLILLMTFSVVNLFFFYFFFEFSLIPTLLIILGWGYQPERLQAGIYFLFYTLGASLPLLLVLFYAYKMGGGLEMNFMLGGVSLFYCGGFILFFFMIMAFMVKMPMFFVHLWLPSAHVEAPVSGSMVLAGVLLKLGGYGVYRVVNYVVVGLASYGGYLFGLSILGMVYVGLMCCRLTDLKALVAYSSVAHMGLVICGLMGYYLWGFLGSLMMMISHGVCSSGMFCAVNIYYERSGSRGFLFNRGLISLIPSFTLMFFMLCAANMAAPPTINLISEISLMGSMLKFDYLMLLFFPLGSYLGALFTLYLFSYSQHGSNWEGGSSFFCINFREFHLMVMHLFPLNLLILSFDFFSIMF